VRVNQQGAVKKRDIDGLLSDRKRLSEDSASAARRSQNAVSDAARVIRDKDDQLARVRDRLATLQSQRDGVAARISSADGSSAPAPVASPAQRSPEAAQRTMEEIYELIGTDKVREAADRFQKQRDFLRANLAAEAFAALQETVKQMAPLR